MSTDIKEFGSEEVRISVDGRGIFREVNDGVEAWRKSDSQESLSNLGADEVVEAKGGSIKRIGFVVGSNFLHKKEDNVRLEFMASIIKDDIVTSDERKGYVSDEDRTKLIAELEAQGFTEITPYSDPKGYYRGLNMKFDGRNFDLGLGPESLEKDIARWSEGKYGSQPEKNNYHRLELKQDNSPNDLDENKFVTSSTTLAGATQRTIWAFDRFYDIGKTGLNLEVKSLAKKEEEQRQKLGYSISSYRDGEYDPRGVKSEPIYSEFDALQWDIQQSHIVEFRALGNRQVLTMNKDSLVFGRWGGLKASEDGNQADVLIDEDVDRDTHKVIKEMGVSRRHFKISVDETTTKALSIATGGVVEDSVVIEDLYPKNTTYVFRGTEVSKKLFGKDKDIGVPKGGKSFVLPGDIIFVGGGSKIDKTEDWVNQKDRGIGLVYLGERKFVKVVLGEGGGDTAVLADILEVTDPEFAHQLTSGGGLLTEAIDSLLEGRIEKEDPAVVQALRVMEKREKQIDAQQIMSDDKIKEKTPEDLVSLLGSSEADESVKLENALSIAKLRNEPLVASYATLTALRLGSVEDVKHLFIDRDFWKKLSPDAVLVCLDHIERSQEMDESVKKDFVSIAFSSRDDEVRVFVRERYERYNKLNLKT